MMRNPLLFLPQTEHIQQCHGRRRGDSTYADSVSWQIHNTGPTVECQTPGYDHHLGSHTEEHQSSVLSTTVSEVATGSVFWQTNNNKWAISQMKARRLAACLHMHIWERRWGKMKTTEKFPLCFGCLPDHWSTLVNMAAVKVYLQICSIVTDSRHHQVC